MISFSQLLEQLEKNKDNTPLMTSGESGPALTVIKSGKELHGEGEASFWEEFISLCSNSDGLAELLGVSREKVNSWPTRIQDQLEKLSQNNSQDKEEKKIVPTGETGAIVTNQDPDLGAIP
jgi:hypothetical protein